MSDQGNEWSQMRRHPGVLLDQLLASSNAPNFGKRDKNRNMRSQAAGVGVKIGGEKAWPGEHSLILPSNPTVHPS